MSQRLGQAVGILSTRHGFDPFFGDEVGGVDGGEAVVVAVVVVLPAGVLGVCVAEGGGG